ncbi:putative type I restriction modification enzyme, M and S domains [Cafeteria roenbergensis virus]|uniref:site-specific DNA-methyltransferase (adenine-specific) n=1 Tax=Cafeteria roenbergensis virus (strain BV-PW1) TaxID=693272 RepID=E3T5F4_CROVB|nr:putative type I restriction modification enzyme, M and S domains [Cafeteria roenbergensis virus BV-PW1]ADO67417.1 putative type I restriction modification enzyme, M and S domains [Cafeteria roenbergensis virus BV-PW1]
MLMPKNKQQYKLELQSKSNKIIYEFTEKELIENKKYDEFKNKFKSKLKSWHNTLSGAGVTGDPALDDIMNIIMLCYLDKHVSDKGQFDLLNLKSYPITKKNRFSKYNYLECLKIDYMIKNKKILIKSKDKNEGKSILEKIGDLLSNHRTTSRVVKDIDFINCKKTNILISLIEDINEFCTKYHIFEYSDIIGIAYEFWMNEYKGGSGKELGNFFTERKLMRMCFELIDKEDIDNLNINKNSTIGDEFCGTFGFPLYFKQFLKDKYKINIKNKNIYGVEFEDRACRMAMLNAMFSLDNIDNVTRGDSFITNVSPHLDISVHNVPFGSRMKYKHVKEHYEEYQINHSDIPNFDEIIKSKANQDATLSSQMVIYKTNKIGICIIKDGQEATGTTKELLAYRKHFCDSVNLKKILKIPSGAFSSTGTKTLCLYFVKDGNKTENLQFLELDTEGNKIIETCNVSYQDLEHNKYLWSPNTYLVDEEILKLQSKSKCEWMKLGDICKFLSKSKKQASYGNNEGKYNFYTSSYKIKKCDEYDYEDECLIIGTGGNVNIKLDSKFCCSSDNIILKSQYNKYIYYLLSYNLNLLEKGFEGAGIKHISKDYIRNLKIPIPSSETQEEIIQQIEILNKEIKNNEDKIKNNQNISKMYMEMMMKKHQDNIEWNKLGDLCEFLSKSKKQASYGNNEGKYNFYTSSYKIKKCDEYDYEDECLIIGTGGNVNIKLDSKFCCSADNIILKSQYNKYIYYLLSYNLNLLEKGFEGAGIKHISKDYIRNLKIPIPLLKIQNNIVDFLDKENELINKLKLQNDTYKNMIKEILDQSY